eukprot:scaffold316287_cov32-Tisochrysis_lutea.AAC.1
MYCTGVRASRAAHISSKRVRGTPLSGVESRKRASERRVAPVAAASRCSAERRGSGTFAVVKAASAARSAAAAERASAGSL